MFLKKIPNLYSRLSLRIKLTLIFVTIFGAMTLIFDALTFRIIIQALESDNDINLYNLAAEFYNAEENSFLLDQPPLIDPSEKKKIFAFSIGSVLVQIRHKSGKILFRQGDFGTYELPVKDEFELLKKDDEVVYRTLRVPKDVPHSEADTFRVISMPWKTQDTILQIAVPRAHIETVIQQRNKVLLLGMPLALLFAALGGSFLSGRALKPVQEVIKIAHEIDGSELYQRVPLPKAEDEIKKLSLTFNEMLDRIEKAFQSQERFVADASHQLLTPLTIMKTELDFALRETNLSPREVNLIKSQMQEVDFLIRIAQDMLLLARIDAGRGALKLQEHYLDEIVLESIERIEKLAQRKDIKLKFDIQGLEANRRPLRVDHDLMIHLVTNLLENAIKYSPKNESISILLQSEFDWSRLTIKDQGVGISSDQFETIFERFSRDPKTSTKVKGYGLGLAIAKKIATLHNAILQPVTTEGQGAEFKFEIKNI